MDRPRRSDCTAGQMDGEAGWWTTSGNIGLPPLARVMGVGRQQQLISETLSNSNHITLNTDTPTRVPNNAHQQPTSPDITTISSSLYNRTTWKTIHALNSDHLPILLTIQTDNKHTIQHNRRSYTNIHDANKTFTNILYQAGKNTYQ